jgi:hypothetical protein
MQWPWYSNKNTISNTHYLWVINYNINTLGSFKNEKIFLLQPHLKHFQLDTALYIVLSIASKGTPSWEAFTISALKYTFTYTSSDRKWSSKLGAASYLVKFFISGKQRSEERRKQHGSSGVRRQSQSREWTLHSDFKTCGSKSHSFRSRELPDPSGN